MQVETVRLFVSRAQAAKPDFCLTEANAPAVSDICHCLEGLPLSIEGRCARASFRPAGTAPTLHPRSMRLAAGAHRWAKYAARPAAKPARHPCLELRLLDPREQRLFRRLAVFSGVCTAEAVEVVCDVDGDLALDAIEGLQALCDNHLLQPRESVDGDSRFTMLETIREYIREQLEALGQEARTVRGRHVEYFLANAREAEANFWGKSAGAVSGTPELNQELDNLRAALAWSRDSGAVEIALQSGGALQWFWHNGGHWTEGWAWLESALALTTPVHRTEGRAAALNAARMCNWCLGDFATACSHTEESPAICRELGDRRKMGRALQGLGVLAAHQVDLASAQALIEEGLSLAQAVGIDRLSAWRCTTSVALLSKRTTKKRRDPEPHLAPLDEALLAGTTEGLCRQLGRLHCLRAQSDDRLAWALTWSAP